MSLIECLTDAQIARIPEFVERWTKIGLCTDPADRLRAEAAIREMYRQGGLEPPSRIVWCGSPLSQGLTRAIIIDRKLTKEIGDSVRTRVVGSVRARVEESVRESVPDSVGGSVWYSVRNSVWAVWDSVRNSVWHSVRARHVIEEPGKIEVTSIGAEGNAEVRRVMIERYRHGEEVSGAAAYVRDSGAERLDHDERFGTLYRRDIPEDEPIVMLEVVNSTTESDGSSKRYWLRVPPQMQTAHEASAWTFGLTPKKYDPLVET